MSRQPVSVARSGSNRESREALLEELLKWSGVVLAFAFAAGCALIVILATPGAAWGLELRLVLGFLVVAPSLLSGLVALSMSRHRPANFQLVCLPPAGGETLKDHVAEDESLWQHRRLAVETSWEYERDRILQSLGRRSLQALIFGALATFALTCSVVVLPWGPWEDHDLLACSIAAAASTAFLINLVIVMLRASGGDATSRTFAWATRSLVLVIVADLGLYVVCKAAGVMSGINSALLLGVFVGATGDQAIQFLLEKGAASFKLGKAEPAQARSPLFDIEGITTEHVERLKEEGILSVHDLAFVPTARLFFSTAYSLQQICNWQDRALLLVYVGKKAADTLAEKMELRGAIDLRAFAHYIQFGEKRDDAERIKKTLGEALKLDEGGLAALVRSMMHDEVAMRIRYYWGSTIGPALQTGPTPRINGVISDAGGRPVATAAVILDEVVSLPDAGLVIGVPR